MSLPRWCSELHLMKVLGHTVFPSTSSCLLPSLNHFSSAPAILQRTGAALVKREDRRQRRGYSQEIAPRHTMGDGIKHVSVDGFGVQAQGHAVTRLPWPASCACDDCCSGAHPTIRRPGTPGTRAPINWYLNSP